MTPEAKAHAIALIKLVPALHDPSGTRSIAGYAQWISQIPAGTPDQQNLYLFMVAATWPDSIKHEWLKDSDTPPPGLTTDVHIGFVDTASHGYWHFVDQGFASDHSAVPATPMPNASTQILAFRQTVASKEDDLLKAYDLMWLEHMVGDIHQPLHSADRYFAGNADEGGNLVPITLVAAIKKAFTTTPRELHGFWDDLPGQGSPVGALTAAVNFAKDLPQASESEANNTDPTSWASDALLLAKRDVYRAPLGAAPKPATGSYMLTQDYFDVAIRDAKSQLALAGTRLAKLLNDYLP